MTPEALKISDGNIESAGSKPEKPPAEAMENVSAPQAPLFVVPSAPDTESLQRHSTSATDTETYPEGGLRAWLVVLGCWLALVASLGLMNTLATFQSYLISHQLAEYGEGTVGWIFSIYTFVVFFLGLYIGPTFDKYGPRWIVMGGTVAVVAGMMLMSISTGECWVFLCLLSVSLQGIAPLEKTFANTASRALALHPVFRHRDRPWLLAPLHAVLRRPRPLLHAAARRSNWHRCHGRLHRRHHLSPDARSPLSAPRLGVVHPHPGLCLPGPLHRSQLPHPPAAAARKKRKRAPGLSDLQGQGLLADDHWHFPPRDGALCAVDVYQLLCACAGIQYGLFV